ncbi:MAG TPA: acylphosphatase [Solirubrobacteraceae bacterium]|nr:acylphosphatase [Solirubrobacteraceae bacterium]
MTDQPVAVCLHVRGRVQGVFFRDSARREAQRRGVAGWAANRLDGSVEIVLEGPHAAVQEVVEWCRHGPRSAHVTGLEVDRRSPAGLRGFEVR